MKSKLKIIIPLALVILGGAWKFAIAKPPPPPKPKVHGHVYVLPKDFIVNLASERLAKFTVALLLHHDYHPGGDGGHGASPPPGFGADPQEALVRDIILDEITGQDADLLQDRKSRHKLKKDLVHEIETKTDVKVEDLLFTDLAVQ